MPVTHCLMAEAMWTEGVDRLPKKIAGTRGSKKLIFYFTGENIVRLSLAEENSLKKGLEKVNNFLFTRENIVLMFCPRP